MILSSFPSPSRRAEVEISTGRMGFEADNRYRGLCFRNIFQLARTIAYCSFRRWCSYGSDAPLPRG
ncbi:hypothetical protein Tcan_03302 [Toxocara canis]|uniref:Uncharacterized protein n=1 Tax=Toxocara canis TaxID=6265 RepID=A0A0B2VXA6_TOXCA|nr:hypothetical protein Tcan_03302 [Toxocara canis]